MNETWSPDPGALRGRVAVVAGATRGCGRGIAAALGEAGATVVCTGRSSRTAALRSDYDRAETIEETAAMVTVLGGTGLARPVDHLDPDQVRDLAGWIRGRFGRIDVLVNDIWGAELLKGGPAEWDSPIWDHDLDKGLRILRLAVDTHLITSHHSAPADFALSETPRFAGWAVAALAADPGRARWNQKSVSSARLARDYGFTDTDGSAPDIWRYIVEVREPGLEANPDDYR